MWFEISVMLLYSYYFFGWVVIYFFVHCFSIPPPQECGHVTRCEATRGGEAWHATQLTHFAIREHLRTRPELIGTLQVA